MLSCLLADRLQLNQEAGMGSDKQVARLEKSGGRAGEGWEGQRGWGLSSVLRGESHSLNDGSLKSSEHFPESFMIRGSIIFPVSVILPCCSTRHWLRGHEPCY